MKIIKEITLDTDLKVDDIILDSLGQERKVLETTDETVKISDVLDKVFEDVKYFTIDYTEMVRQGYQYKREETSEEATEREEKELLARCDNSDEAYEQIKANID